MFKRIGAFFVDLFLFVSFVWFILVLVLVVIYMSTHDLAVINEMMKTNMRELLWAVYGLFLFLLFLYFVAIPLALKGTIGETLFGLTYAPKERFNLLSMLAYRFFGILWDIILFPYSLFALIRKTPFISEWLSGLTITKVTPIKRPGSFTFVAGFFALLFIFASTSGVLLYKNGVVSVIERFTDHEKQTQFYIDQRAFTTAELSLEKYKIYNGENSTYRYFKCIITGQDAEDLTALPLCTQVLTEVSQDKERSIAVLTVLAELNNESGNPEEALKHYKMLWTDYGVRDFNMTSYVKGLSESNQAEEALKVMNELYNAMKEKKELTSQEKMLFAGMYNTIGAEKEAIAIYTEVISHEEQSQDADIMFLGTVYMNTAYAYYQSGDYTNAKKYFILAKEKNPDLQNEADTYIIDITKFKK